MDASAEIVAYRSLITRTPRATIGTPTSTEPERVHGRAWVSDRLSIIRSLLLAVVFKGSAWLHYNARSDPEVVQSLGNCWEKKLKLWSTSEHGSHFTDTQILDAWKELSPNLNRLLNTTSRYRSLERVKALRNICSHVGFHDIEADGPLARLLDGVSRALLDDLQRIEEALTPNQRQSVTRYRSLAKETLPILRSTRFPPAWPHPRLEWWGWSPREQRRANKVVSPGMPLFALYFPNLAETQSCNNTEHNLPPSPRPHEPRPVVVEALDKFWSHPAKSSHLLVGHGGIGKTAEALCWAWDLMKNPGSHGHCSLGPKLILFQSHKQDFYSEFGLERILDGESQDPIDSLAKTLVATLQGVGCLPAGGEVRSPLQILEETESKPDRVKRRLVIIDNCETLDPGRVERARDAFMLHAKVLLTSRKNDWGYEETGVTELDDAAIQVVLLDLLKPHLSAEELGEQRLSELVRLAAGRPLLVHAAIKRALQEPDPSLVSAIEFHLGEMGACSSEGLAAFMAESGWRSLNRDQRLLVATLYRLAVSSGFDTLGEEELELLLRCANNELERRLNVDSLYAWLEKRPDLFELLPVARGGSSLVLAWGLRSWLEEAGANWAKTLELTPEEFQAIGQVEQAWNTRTNTRPPASESTFLDYLRRGLTKDEAKGLAASAGEQLLESLQALAESADASEALVLYASWLKLDQAEAAPPDSIRKRVQDILVSDPTNPWARVVLGRFYCLQARSEILPGRTRDALAKGWQQFDSATGSPMVRRHVELARLDTVAEVLDARPELAFGDPDDPDDHLVLVLSSGERRNLLDAIHTVERWLKEDIHEALKGETMTRSEAEGLRGALRQTMADIGWRGAMALDD